MRVRDLKQQSVTPHNFSLNPRAPVQRSSFPVRQGFKAPFGASYLIPIYCEEVMPGDMFNIRCDCIARTATPIVPVMDNWQMDIQFFYVPNRITYENWEKLMGAQDNPDDSTSYLVPQLECPAGGWPVSSLGDYFGLGIEGQIVAPAFQSVNALPFRAYNKIWNDWYRDQNLQDSVPENTGDGPDDPADYELLFRNKAHDYFAGALPFVQKGPAVSLPLGTTAPLQSTGIGIAFDDPAHARTGTALLMTSGSNTVTWSNTMAGTTGAANFGPAGNPMPSLEVNLTEAAGAEINTLRTAIATQQLLERDARGGTRYVESIFAHWGVRPLDYRLDRPEYIGGGRIPILMNAIPQTSETADTPQGNLAATGYASGRAGFSYAATEHGYIIGLASVRADQTYSEGLRRHWSRRTRMDFPFPEFANLGEQPIYQKEIYALGSATGGITEGDADMEAFGYIPRYDECRYFPSQIVGLFRPAAANNIAYWHSSFYFGSGVPHLNSDFIRDSTRGALERNFAAGDLANDQQFITDFLFTGTVTRPLPVHAVPGLTRF